MARDIGFFGADMTKRINHMQKAIEQSKKDTLKAASMVAKETQLDEMRGDAGGDLILSRVRSGKGAKIGASFNLSLDGSTIKATGPLPLLASKIPAHKIPKAGKAKMLAIPGIGVRRSVNHPGTPGKDTWNRGREKAEPKITAVVGKRTDKAVIDSFKNGG